MARNREDLCLSARYIHTGNSGVSLYVNRDVKRPERAVLTVGNGAFGAFSTKMEICGNDYKGMTAPQLRDLSLMFMEAASHLEDGTIPLMTDVPSILPDNEYGTLGRSCRSPGLQDLLPTFRDSFNIRGSVLVPVLLREHPELREFYTLFVDTESTRKQESESGMESSKESSKEDPSQDTPARRKEKAEARREAQKQRRLRNKQDRILSKGFAFLRAYWHSMLSDSVMAQLKTEYVEALEAMNSEPESDEDDDDCYDRPLTTTLSQITSKKSK